SSVLNPTLKPFLGKRMSDVAAAWHKDAIDAICDFLIQDHAATSVSVFGMDEKDVELALKQPWVSVDNDSGGTSPEGILGEDHPHPRAYGTFPRILSKFVRQEHLLTLPDAIRKFSALPAQRLRITDRGVLKKGLWADIVVFDPDKVHDVATYENPNQFSVGMDYVLVNGKLVIDNGTMTGILAGQVLLGPGYKH
ncbi:MAG TPA: amidohydrolase family protein, partial [Candidatus Acidoferrales bacterium]|nr:amidohydrolase family protein [Candidatus Acidoferrales bacterium]